MTATVTTPLPGAKRVKLRSDQALALVGAQARYDNAKRELDDAREHRDRLIERFLPKFELGEWVIVAGYALRITIQRSGQRFRLGEFLQHHKLAPSMRPFVTESTESPRLWVKPAKVK